MNFVEELDRWLEENIVCGASGKAKWKQAVLMYYGGTDAIQPSYEEIGRRLEIGSKERVRQILKACFAEKATLSQLPLTKQTLTVIGERGFASIGEILGKLQDKRLATNSMQIRSCLKLASDLGARIGVKVYDERLKDLKRKDAEPAGNAYVVSDGLIDTLRKELRQVRRFPCNLGLAKLADCFDALGIQHRHEVERIVRASSYTRLVTDGQETWYVAEDYENRLINCCKKAFCFVDQVHIGVLAEVLRNSLRGRSSEYEYPKIEVIAKWIASSSAFKVLPGNYVTFQSGAVALSPIEQDVAQYLTCNEQATLDETRAHLVKLGYKETTCTRLITACPFIYIDRSPGKRNFRYQLIPNVGKAQPNARSRRCARIKERLRQVLLKGTNHPVNVIHRREQAILGQFLFEGKQTEKCAICQQEYSVNALVAAHKKKRAECSEEERVDPNVVFPLCKFGCDHLYEERAVRVENQKVILGNLPANNSVDARRAKELCGTVISREYWEGAQRYFHA